MSAIKYLMELEYELAELDAELEEMEEQFPDIEQWEDLTTSDWYKILN